MAMLSMKILRILWCHLRARKLKTVTLGDQVRRWRTAGAERMEKSLLRKMGKNLLKKSLAISEKVGSRKKKNQGKSKRKKEEVEAAEKIEDALYKFPMNRVSRIIRSEISNVRLSQEAVFVINRASLSTITGEKFLDLFSREAYACAFLDRKSYIAYDHLSSVVSKRKRFDFVSDFVPERLKAEDALVQISECEK